MVLPYVQLLPECNHYAMVGSCLYLYAFQSGSIGAEALRLYRLYESGPVFFGSFASIERGTVLEIHAGGCAGNIRPIHILGRCNRFRTGKRILQSFLYCCFQACGYKKRDDRHTPLLFI
mgnify:CR=1 FL=1